MALLTTADGSHKNFILSTIGNNKKAGSVEFLTACVDVDGV